MFHELHVLALVLVLSTLCDLIICPLDIFTYVYIHVSININIYLYVYIYKEGEQSKKVKMSNSD